MKPVEAPFSRCYWVVPGKLLAGSYPGDKDSRTADMKLSGLLQAGIRHVINLMEQDERDHNGMLFTPYEDRMEKLANKNRYFVTFDQLPIKDLSIPAERHMIRIFDQIDLCIRCDKPVYVHCWGGRGRTGTVVGCYLARHGLATGNEALSKISELRSKTADAGYSSPETSEQVRMVLSWQKGR